MSESKILTPVEFAEKMDEITGIWDFEQAHKDADNLLAELLDSLGYEDGIKLYRDMNKWYA